MKKYFLIAVLVFGFASLPQLYFCSRNDGQYRRMGRGKLVEPISNY